MKKTDMPGPEEEALKRMIEREIPDPNPIRQAAVRRAYLDEARRLRQMRAVSQGTSVRHTGWRFIYGLFEEHPVMTTLAKALVIMLALSGLATGTTLAADASAPGDPLYPADLAMEQARLVVMTRVQSRAQLMLHLSEERAEELIQNGQAGEPLTEADVFRLREQVQLMLMTMAELDGPQRTQLLTQLQQRARQYADAFEALGLDEQAALMTRTREMAELGLGNPDAFTHRWHNGIGWSDEPVASPPGEGQQMQTQNQEQNQVQNQNQAQEGMQQHNQAQQQNQEQGEPAQEPLQSQEQIQQQTQNQQQSGQGGCEEPGCGPGPGSDGAPGGDDAPGGGEGGGGRR